MPRKPVVFLDKEYKTQGEFEKYVRKIIYDEIGICYDVKNTYPDKYNILIKILERHPNFNSKSENMCNIKIIKDALNFRALQIIILKNDNSEIDISWRCAITGKHKPKKSLLTGAMRTSIEDQIHTFRRNCDTYTCELCGSVEELHVDHNDEKKSAFDELANNFVKENNNIYPDKFGDLEDGTNRRCFLKEDNDFKKKWIEYHHKHAILRILCRKCNLSRPKTKNKLVL